MTEARSNDVEPGVAQNQYAGAELSLEELDTIVGGQRRRVRCYYRVRCYRRGRRRVCRRVRVCRRF